MLMITLLAILHWNTRFEFFNFFKFKESRLISEYRWMPFGCHLVFVSFIQILIEICIIQNYWQMMTLF